MKHFPLIITENLSRTYLLDKESIHVLKQVNLILNKGESVALMGPSGSGKSTLLHVLGCLDRPTQGGYFFNNQNVSTLSDEELAHIRSMQIGFVFQSFNLIPQLTIFENVRIPFLYQPLSLSKKIQDTRIFQALEQVQLQHRFKHLPSQLSGGEMQRVAIARALAIQPLLILADEPTGNLDTETGKAILQIFKELNAQGVTLIIVTHDAQVAASCQRMIKIQDGKIMLDQMRSEVINANSG